MGRKVDVQGEVLADPWKEPIIHPLYDENNIYLDGQKHAKKGGEMVDNPWPRSSYAAACWHDGFLSVD